VPGSAAKRVASTAEMAESWLARQVRDNGLSLDFSSSRERTGGSSTPTSGKVLFHTHCHQKALVGSQGSVAALKLIPTLDVTALDAGCCGMAGAFGYEREHYDLSVRIANLALIPAVTAEPGATVVATGTSCRHQLRDLTSRYALHPLEVLSRELGVES